MRLTLRTLLAWIDGVLPPAEREELAAKVKASPVAPALILRIREVMEDPAAAPPADGPDTEDPNAVAEYLDNVLAPDRLEGFERRCLTSVGNLAEVAACHRILAAAARNPEQLTPLVGEPRRRLIRAVAEGLARESAEPPGQLPGSEAAAAADAIAVALAPSGGAAAPGPRVMREERASAWAWLAAAVALAVLVGLGGLLARAIWPPPRSAVGEIAARPVNPQHPQPVGGEPAAASREPAAEPGPAEPASAEAGPTASASPPAQADRDGPRAASTIGSAAIVPLPEMATATDPALSIAGGDDSEPDLAIDTDPPPAPPPGRVAAGDPLLRRVGNPATARWQPSVSGDSLAATEELLSPSLCYPMLERGDLTIRLLPGTQAILATAGDGTSRLEILFGRVVVWTDAAVGGSLGVTAGGLAGTVTLGPRQPLGIEVHLTHEPGDDPAVVPPGQSVAVSATGGAEWLQAAPAGRGLVGIEKTQSLPPRSRLCWTAATPDRARVELDQPEPRWLTEREPAGRTLQAARVAIAECLTDVPADGVVAESLRSLARDRRAENRMAAASTLALLGEFDDLVRLLCESDAATMLRGSQWTAVLADTIPLALGRGLNAAARLNNAFRSQAPAGRGEQLFRLACGLSPADFADGGGAALVAALDDPELAVRRFAVAELRRAAGDESEPAGSYRPDRDASLNQKGVAWWQSRIKALGDGGEAVPGQR